MNKTELAAALDFAVAEAKAGGARTFLLVWETGAKMELRTHPQSAALLRGVVDMLAEAVLTGPPEDDDEDEDDE